MNNLINNSVLNNISNILGQNSIKLPIEVLEGDISKISMGQNILLNIDFDNNIQKDLSQLISKLNIQLNNQNIELLGKIRLPNILQDKDFTDRNPNLKISAKIITKTGNQIEVKIDKINNQNTSQFIKNSTNLRSQTTSINKNNSVVETNLLKQNYNAEFVSKDIIANVRTDNPEMVKEVGKLINNLSLSLKIKSVSTPEKPITQTEINKTIENPDSNKYIDKKTEINIDKLYKNIKKLVDNNLNKTIQAKVIKELPDNKVIIKSKIGNLIINNQTNLKVNDNLEIELNKLIENNKFQTRNLNFFDDKMDIKTPKKWDSLDKIITHLKNSGDVKTAEIINNKIPNIKNNLLSNMIKFISATKENDASIWLGKDIIEIIKDKLPNSSELLANLDKDIEKSSFRVEHMGNEWRIINIPFIDEEAMVKIRAIIKQYDKIKEKQNKNKKHKNTDYGSRFIIDTNFSYLGAFQFDGLSFENKKKFDLILRTEKPIDKIIIKHITSIFKKSISELNYHGNIFINQEDKFITIEEKNIVDIVEETDKISNQGIWV